MTYNHLKELLLEGAPNPDIKRVARKAMNHYSYSSYSFRITHGCRKMGLTDKEAEHLVVSVSDLFYNTDLPRFERTGSFDSASPANGGGRKEQQTDK